MIKMIDNDMKNTFAFFCDVCRKQITKHGECLFVDTKPEMPVIPVFTHYECSAKFEMANDYGVGNMHLSEFAELILAASRLTEVTNAD